MPSSSAPLGEMNCSSWLWLLLEKTESRSRPDRGIVYVETVAWNQRDEIVCEFRRRVLIPKRPT